jgi:glycosyltransferase involved in cell wall biosynthesis
MKIIMHNPWGTGDSGTYDCSLCYELYKKNINITLITNWYYEYDELSNFKVAKVFFKYSEIMKRSILRKLIRGCEYCFTMLNLLNKYSKESPDIIHIQWLLFYQFDYFWLKILKYLLRRKNTKIILTAHNILPHVNEYKYKNILEKIYSNFDGIIVHSEVLKEQMIKIFGVNAKNWPIYVTSIGIEDKLLEKVDQNILNSYRDKVKLSESDGNNFLFVGIIHKNKGLDVLLKSWGEHINKYPSDKLYIIGKTTYNISNELRFIERFHSSIITSFGYKSDEELLAYFLECDFVVLPYKEASQSGVLMTALSLGKPVIATNVGGLPEVVETVKGGYIVDSNNPNSLCKAINKASEISDRELSEWNNDIRKKTLTKYSWDNIAKLTVHFYNEVCSIPNIKLNKN